MGGLRSRRSMPFATIPVRSSPTEWRSVTEAHPHGNPPRGSCISFHMLGFRGFRNRPHTKGMGPRLIHQRSYVLSAVLSAIAFAGAAGRAALPATPSADTVLGMMGRSAQDFRSLSAD